jgi:hypothetical protein
MAASCAGAVLHLTGSQVLVALVALVMLLDLVCALESFGWKV